MRFHKKTMVAIIMLGVFAVTLLTGCGQRPKEAEKLRDLDFTVVQESELPEQLRLLVGEKKCNPFKLTYAASDYLYIAQGYGAQPTGGYSVTVNELWLAEEAIYFCSELLGPGESENVTQNISYPYVVVKTELIDQQVIFK